MTTTNENVELVAVTAGLMAAPVVTTRNLVASVEVSNEVSGDVRSETTNRHARNCNELTGLAMRPAATIESS